MIRIATAAKKRRIREELMLPSPARIERLCAEIRSHWSPSQLARRAGHAARVRVMLVSALDMVAERSEEV
jgi:hypothetical protein